MITIPILTARDRIGVKTDGIISTGGADNKYCDDNDYGDDSMVVMIIIAVVFLWLRAIIIIIIIKLFLNLEDFILKGILQEIYFTSDQ